MMMMDEMGSNNQAIEDEIRQTKEKVATAQVRSVNKGKAKFKRMLLKAYKAELKFRLD